MMMEDDEEEAKFMKDMRELTNTKKGDVVREALDYASTQGILMASKDQAGSFSNAPFALLPNEFPASEYAKARRLAMAFNLLVSLVDALPRLGLHTISSRIII